MIYNKSNSTFEYKGKTYKIGDKIFATAESEYQGLLGTITEIRTGTDKDTDNEEPDIYCAFDAPVIPYFVKQLEKRFSELYGTPKKLEDIALDLVIMAPSMIMSCTELSEATQQDIVYIVKEDWACHDESDVQVSVFSDLTFAQVYMCQRVAEEIAEDSCPFDCRGEEGYEEDSSDTFYEIYEDGWYNNNHFTIQIEQKTVIGSKLKKNYYVKSGENALRKITTKVGVLYMEAEHEREEPERIKIYDSMFRYLDYLPIESAKPNETVAQYCDRVIKHLEELESIDEILRYLGISSYTTGITWTHLLEDIYSYDGYEYDSEADRYYELPSGDEITRFTVLANDCVNMIGDIYVLRCD